ncbi:receptor-like protein 20 isoform X1 [Citrus sinensis]|nr:receptor-like protein 20 isoform X1 [Citrus sinensis]
MGYLTQPCPVLICLQLLLLYFQCSAKLCSHDQSSALLQFKQLFSFEQHSSSDCDEVYQQSRPKMMSWKEDADCCSWDGVTCDTVAGHVIGLDLSCSWLHGNIPSNSSLFFLPHIRKLNLAFNDFNYSEISSGFSQLRSLTLLNLSSSNFMGSIPASIGNITQLSYLDLSYNNFNGHIPSSFSNLEQLHYLILRSNFFVGKIPDIFTNLTQLSYLDFSSNQLSGSIPSSVYELENLILLRLSSNRLSGTAELYDFAKLKNLKWLFVSNNRLSLSTKLKVNSSFPNLFGLGLSACNVSEFPDILRTLHQLQWLNLSKNRIHGRIPSWMWDLGIATLYYLDLSNNFLTNIEYFPPTNMTQLNFDSNLTHKVLDMRMNNFNGKIPRKFVKSCNLTSLNLNGNRLEGPLPPSLVNCHHLEVLNVGNNQINDNFPNWLEILPELQVLILRSNRFWGPIGENTTIVPFPSLRIIDLSHNEFTGVLLTGYLDNFKAMMHGNNISVEVDYMTPLNSSNYYESIILTIKGIDIKMERILTIFMTIDLSSNKFQGGIPEVVGKLNLLKGLNISHNNLTVLNLSYNQFEGPIPRGSQFNTFPNDSYVGNSGLCGFPLLESCNIDEAPEPVGSTRFDEEEDASSWFDWKFAKMGYGSGLVIGLSVGYMVFGTGKPRWLVRMIEKYQSNKVRIRVSSLGIARRN